MKISFEPADADTAAALGISEGAEVTVRERIMRANGLPVQLATSRLSREITQGTLIEKADTGKGGSYARLEEAGHPLEHFVETVSTRMPTPEEASMLQLENGTPILTVRRIAYSTEGKAVEVNDMRLSGDKYELSYEFPAS
ncbi:GntR family transcriptional regulator [Amycolatopsis nivea]